jgi:hypothetical protein
MNLESTQEESTISIWIVDLNTELTRRAENSKEYNVHFNLSGTPSQTWKDMFDREWQRLTEEDLWQTATIRGRHLVMRSPLDRIRMTHLPTLKQAVRATNIALRPHPMKRSVNFARRDDTHDDERKAAEALSDSLRFE